MQRQRHLGVEAPVFQATSRLENILDFKLNIGSSRKTLGLNALSKCKAETVMPDAAGLESSHLSGFSLGLNASKASWGFPVIFKGVQLDFPLAPTPDTDFGARYRNHPSSQQLERRLGTGKQLGRDCASPASRPAIVRFSPRLNCVAFSFEVAILRDTDSGAGCFQEFA